MTNLEVGKTYKMQVQDTLGRTRMVRVDLLLVCGEQCDFDDGSTKVKVDHHGTGNPYDGYPSSGTIEYTTAGKLIGI